MGPTVSTPSRWPDGSSFRLDLSGAQAQAYRQRFEQALTQLPEGPSHERLVLTANLVACLLELDPAAAVRCAEDVRGLAATLQTPAARAYALVVHGLTDHHPGSVHNRVTDARHILAAAHEGQAPELAGIGHFLLLTALLQQGQLRALDVEMSPYGESLIRFPELNNARHVAWFRCLRSILDGRIADAEQQADELLATATEDQWAASRSVWAAQIGTIRWMQGRIFEMEEAFLEARQEHPQQRLWAISLAWLWELQGRDDAARALFREFADFDAIPRDRNFLVTATLLAELTAKIGTRDQMEQLRSMLLPYACQVVSIGYGLGFWGTIARTLGILSTRLGLIQEARSLFTTAIDVCARSGAQAWLAEAQLELADLDISLGTNLEASRSLARQARATSAALGFPALLARAEQTLARLPMEPVPSEHPTDQPPHADGRAHVRVLGAFEVVAVNGTRPRWTSRKARELLKLLVARRGIAAPREEFMHQLWPDVDPTLLANRFSVALSTIRRALDPGRDHPPDRFIVAEGQGLHLNTATVHVDVEQFMTAAQGDAVDALRRAVWLYTGETFAEEPYADWALPLRRRAQTAFCVAAHKLAEHEAAEGRHLEASELYRRILDIEPLDERAHARLVDTLTALGVPGQVVILNRTRQELEDELTG